MCVKHFISRETIFEQRRRTRSGYESGRCSRVLYDCRLGRLLGRLSPLKWLTCRNTWGIFTACECVCNAVTFESLDLESSCSVRDKVRVSVQLGQRHKWLCIVFTGHQLLSVIVSKLWLHITLPELCPQLQNTGC